MGVGVGVASQPGQLLRVQPQLLVVGEGVEAVRVEVVEAGAAIAVAAALGGHQHAREAAVLRAVRVGEDLHLRDRVEPGGRVPDGPEDGVGRGLPVLDVAHAVAAAAQELDVVEPAEDVGVQEQERLDVPAVARKVVELLLVEAAGDRPAVERDVVEGFRGNRHRLGHGAQLQLRVHVRRACRPQHDSCPLELLELGGCHLDAVAPRPQVGRLVAALRVGVHRARDARGLVHDQDGRPGYGPTLRIRDRPADRPQEGLGQDRSRQGDGKKQRKRQAQGRNRARRGPGYERVFSHLNPPRHPADHRTPVAPSHVRSQGIPPSARRILEPHRVKNRKETTVNGTF